MLKDQLLPSSSTAMSSGPPPSRFRRIGMPLMRMLGGAMGATTTALGAYAIARDSGSIENVVNNIYRMIFGILIVLAELRMSSLLTWFSFLTYFAGLGAFYIFVGGLAMGGEWYELTMAIAMCVMGVLYLGSACACSEYAHQHTARSEASAKAANNERAAASAERAGNGAGSPHKELEDGESRRGGGKGQRLNESPFGDSAGDDEEYGYGGRGGGRAQASRGAYGGGEDDGNPFAGHNPRSSAYG